MDQNVLNRLVGGSPLRTLLWLVVMSIVVGFVLDTIGLDPFGFLRRLIADFDRFVDWLVGLGFDAFRNVGRYLVWGAVFVVPIWLLMRLTRRG